jgi:mRNA interferase MazF
MLSLKRRPALVITDLKGYDPILCQITAHRSDEYSITITKDDCKKGGLKRKSFVRTNRIFTTDYRIIVKRVAKLKEKKMNEIINKIVEIIQS